VANEDPADLVPGMGWETLPYGCVGLARSTQAGTTRVWSWLILIPWAMNDSKPWIDGTKLFDRSVGTEADERNEVIHHMRSVLDDRYGESVGERSIERFLRSLQDEA
jgi:hypothetical protein